MRFRKKYLALGNNSVNMIDLPGNKLLQQIMGLLVAQMIEPRPQFFRGLIFFMPIPEACERGFSNHGAGTLAMNSFEIFVIQNVYELRNQNAGLTCLRAHRQLVAEIAHGGLSHSGQAQMLSQSCHIFQVKFIQRDDAVNVPGTGCIAHRGDQFGEAAILPA